MSINACNDAGSNKIFVVDFKLDNFLKNSVSKERMKCINAMGGIIGERKSFLVQESKGGKAAPKFLLTPPTKLKQGIEYRSE